MSLAEELIVLGLLLLAAYVLGRLGKLVGLPAIPIYMVVGLLASPHTDWFPLYFDAARVELVAIFGLILLLFNLGLEFDLEGFLGDAPRMLVSGGLYIVVNMGAGLAFGFLTGWGPREALIIAGMVGTSSSAVITKLLIGLRRLPNAETPMLLGVTIVGDVFIAFYLAVVSVVLSNRTELWPIVLELGTAFTFLVVMFVIARWGGRVVSRLTRGKDEELFTVLFFGLALLFAGIGEFIGVTDAIGAFMIGLVLGVSRHRARIERLSVPLRDLFAAFFFLDFGLTLDIAHFPSVLGPVALAVVMTLVLNVALGLVTARLNHLDAQAGLNAAGIFLSRGEFTLILATLSVAAGLNSSLEPFAGLYVLIMAVLGPLFAANSERIGRVVLRRRRPAAPLSVEAREGIALVEAVGADDDEAVADTIERLADRDSAGSHDEMEP